ncbi:MAG: hypothetical protein QOI20_3131 [Acidimicrobiaceae bacterium]|jgi:hypothetical protein|nr:hypothetical protein [Acidimicrobiaceae bacterium]
MRWEAMTPAERRSGDPAEMLRMSLHHERRQMVIDDLEAMPTAPLIVAEGTCVPASASAARPHRAVWLLPSEEFQQSSLAMRSLDRGSLEMYMLLSQQIVDEARAHRLPTVRVDRTHPLDAVMEAVEDAFSAALTNGPRILVMTDRRILLREINQAVVAQVRGYYARPWAAGDADSVIQSFVCECGEAACTAEVSTTVGAAAAQPIVAHPFDERLRHHEA